MADIPRSIDEQGNQRYDQFVFVLKDNNDKNKIQEKAIVELIE